MPIDRVVCLDITPHSVNMTVKLLVRDRSDSRPCREVLDLILETLYAYSSNLSSINPTAQPAT